MKNKGLSAIIFVVVFIATYILLCFEYTGSKMALEATPFDYIRVAITYMALFKIIVSLVVASIVGAIPTIVGKSKR